MKPGAAVTEKTVGNTDADEAAQSHIHSAGLENRPRLQAGNPLQVSFITPAS